MNKNVIFSFIILMITAFSVSLASCGSDDDDSVASGSSLLVGTWSIDTWSSPDSYRLMTFKADGTGVGQEKRGSASAKETWQFTYVYNKNKLIITEEDGDITSNEVITLNDKELIYQFVEKDGVVSQRRFSRN